MYTTDMNATAQIVMVNNYRRNAFYLKSLLFLLQLFLFQFGMSQTCTSGGVQTTYGAGSWIGYVYDHTGAGNPVTTPFATYKGYVTETEIFDRNWTTGNPSCAAGANNFAVRYRMNRTFASGNYTFTIGADDGVRLSIDGGVTWVLNRWSDNSYGTVSMRIPLAGTYDLVLEYYEKSGDARVTFGYTSELTTDLRMSNAAIRSVVTTCGGRFYDSGGSAGDYVNSEDVTLTFYPTVACKKVSLNFTSFRVEPSTSCSDWDILRIYNGNSTAAPLLRTSQTDCATRANPGIVTSTAADGSLTVHFKSDGSVINSGWEASVSCVDVPSVSSMSSCPSNITTSIVASTCRGKASWTAPTFANYCQPIITGGNYMGVFGGNYYYHIPAGVTWTAARADAIAKGGRLVTIETAAENTFLTNYLTTNGIAAAWIGYTDEVTEGNFVSVTGVPLSYGNVPSVTTYDVYNNWGVSEPNDASGEDFASITSTGNWNDLGAGASVGYFLEFGAFQTSGYANGAANFPLGSTTVTYQVIAPGANPASCSFTVTVTGAPTASLTTAAAAICYGNSVVLGGNVTATGPWTVTLNNGSTASGTGNGTWTASVIPTATTTYSISNISASGCLITGTGSTTITLPPKSANLGASGESVTCPVNGTNWIDFHHPTSGNYLGSVNANGSNLGNVTISTNVGLASSTYACNHAGNEAYRTAFMGRNWIFNSSTYNGTAFPVSANVRLPYDGNELSAMNALASSVTTGNAQDNGATIGTIMLTKFTGAIEDYNPGNNCSGGVIRGVFQTSNALLSPAIPNASYVQFPVTEFSEMYLNKQTIFGPLPVTLTQFTATCDQAVTLNWRTASEQNSDRFVVESSEDLTNWETVAEIQAAGNSTTTIDYSTSDNNRRSGVSYYRLVQLDLDGEQEVFGPISVSCDVISNDFKVYPNPSNGKFTVELLSNQSEENVIITLSDVTGKIIETRKVHVLEGSNQFVFDAIGYELGTYIVRLGSKAYKYTPVKVVLVN